MGTWTGAGGWDGRGTSDERGSLFVTGRGCASLGGECIG